jgi:hypothetical protein
VYHGSQAGRVALKERQLRVPSPGCGGRPPSPVRRARPRSPPAKRCAWTHDVAIECGLGQSARMTSVDQTTPTRSTARARASARASTSRLAQGG